MYIPSTYFSLHNIKTFIQTGMTEKNTWENTSVTIPQYSCISSQTRDTNTHMLIYWYDLLLISGQLRRCSLQSNKDGVCLIFKTYGSRSQFHRFHSILHLM